MQYTHTRKTEIEKNNELSEEKKPFVVAIVTAVKGNLDLRSKGSGVWKKADVGTYLFEGDILK